MQPEFQRVREYLVAQSAKLTIPELVTKLRQDAMPLRDVAASVPADRFDERPGEGEWSASEVFTHVLEMTEHGDAVVTAMIAGETPPSLRRDEITGATRSGLSTAADYWHAFEELRAPFYERVLLATGDEHLDLTLEHFWFGPLNWRQWMLFMRVHDLAHIGQIREIAERFSAA
jgi:hypothetical protein